jgi:hypothetical protein
MEIGIWTAILTAIVAAFAGLGATGYIIWDIKRFQTKSEQEYLQFKSQVIADTAKIEKELKAQMAMHSESLKAQAQAHRNDLHNANGSLIYVTDPVCRDRMANCPAGHAVRSFVTFEQKLDDMEEKWRQTRECFIEALSEIRTTLKLLLPKEPRP